MDRKRTPEPKINSHQRRVRRNQKIHSFYIPRCICCVKSCLRAKGLKLLSRGGLGFRGGGADTGWSISISRESIWGLGWVPLSLRGGERLRVRRLLCDGLNRRPRRAGLGESRYFLRTERSGVRDLLRVLERRVRSRDFERDPWRRDRGGGDRIDDVLE